MYRLTLFPMLQGLPFMGPPSVSRWPGAPQARGACPPRLLRCRSLRFQTWQRPVTAAFTERGLHVFLSI